MTETTGSLDRAPAAPTARPLIIRPPGRLFDLGMRELWRSRAILLALARRSLMVRYRHRILGAAWVLFQPLALMVVFTLFFGLMARMPSDGLPYAVFVLTGLLAWGNVSKILAEGSSSLANNSVLITRVYFPRAYLPMAVVIASLIDILVDAVALVGLMLYHSILPTAAIVAVPFLLLIGVAAALGVTFVLASLQAAYRDVANFVPFLTQLWFFLTPIIYPSSIVPAEIRIYFWLNPMALVVEGLRWALAGTPAPPVEAWVIGSVMAFLILAAGYLFFRRREPTIADHL
ncbi:MAG: ABC transporter permease [Candidatus Limnocylindrales bacterium]